MRWRCFQKKASSLSTSGRSAGAARSRRWRGPHRRDRQGRESQFQPRRFIAAGMADIHRRIVAAGYFRGSGPDGFAGGVGPVFGDVNHVHPFHEGNGRAQLQYLKQLAARAGHVINLTRIDRAARLDASRRSNAGNHAAIVRCIRQALVYVTACFLFRRPPAISAFACSPAVSSPSPSARTPQPGRQLARRPPPGWPDSQCPSAETGPFSGGWSDCASHSQSWRRTPQ